MSRSPRAEKAKHALDEYVAGWQAIFRLLREGRSWSGRERNNALLNCGGARFADVSAVTGLDFPDDGRAFATVDWDGDGDLDLWLYNRTGPRLRLMLNSSAANGNASVALRLRGTRANRDGVGARVEVELADPPRRLAETLYAGDGFLSQSSKWLHFGLGQDPVIRGVTVRWPGGAAETFTGVEPGGRYLLVEGRGAAEVRETRPRAVTLAPAPQTPPEPRSAGRVLLPVRLPLPELRYRALDGAGADGSHAVAPAGKPLLVNVWASWCLPCVGELRELGERHAELATAGVDVLAVTVDGLDQSQDTGPEDARRFLDRIGFAFDAGVATPELLEKLELVEEIVYDRKWPFAVPVSYLLDRRGRLAAVYRGRVGVDELLADVAVLDASPEELQHRSAPLAGRWQAPLPGVDLLWMARTFKERFADDHERFLELALERGAGTGPRRKEREAALLLEAAEAAHARGRVEESMTRLARALELQPDLTLARNNLAQLLREAGRTDEALHHYRLAVAADPDDAEARYGLGMTLLSTGDVGGAFGHLEESSRLAPEEPAPLHAMVWILLGYTDPDDRAARQEALRLAERGAEITRRQDARMLDVLAMAYAEFGRFGDAAATAREALELARALGEEQVAAQIAMRLGYYERGQPFREDRGRP